MSEATLNTVISNDRTLEKRLVNTQEIAGSLFSVFVILHLSNIFLAPMGVETFNQYQRFIRQFYQNPVIEIGVVIGPLLVHAASGIWLYFLRRGRNLRRPLPSRVHAWAGLFLLLFIGGHILAVRGSSFFFGVYPEFEGLSFSLWFFPAYFYPYYFLLALAGFYHVTNGLRTLAARRGIRVPIKAQMSVSVIAAIWIMISLMSLGGIFFDVPGQTDNEFARLAAELTNMDPSKPWK